MSFTLLEMAAMVWLVSKVFAAVIIGGVFIAIAALYSFVGICNLSDRIKEKVRVWKKAKEENA